MSVIDICYSPQNIFLTTQKVIQAQYLLSNHDHNSVQVGALKDVQISIGNIIDKDSYWLNDKYYQLIVDDG